jgi:hypothetical protein
MKAPGVKRRAWLVDSVHWLAALALLSTAGAPRSANATKATKSDFFYRDHPKEGKRCADCRLFVPDTNSEGKGACGLIDGVISADGWCMAYSPK